MPRANLILTLCFVSPLLGISGCAGPVAEGPTPDVPAARDAPQGNPQFDAPFLPVPPGVPDPPSLRPSGQSPDTYPITTDAYGAFTATPDAPALGDTAQDFKVALASGGTFDLGEARAAGPVLLMFYRGFW